MSGTIQVGKKLLTANQLNAPKKKYAYYPNGHKKAVVVHILGDAECPCNWENDSRFYTDGNKVYQRL